MIALDRDQVDQRCKAVAMGFLRSAALPTALAALAELEAALSQQAEVVWARPS